MVYVPNASDSTQPTSSTDASTAAAEFRAIKAKVNTLSGYAVGLNPADSSTDLLVFGAGLVVIKQNGVTPVAARANVGKVLGTWYFEVKITNITGLACIGVGYITAALGIGVGGTTGSWGYRSDGQAVTASSPTGYGDPYATGDVIGVIVNATAGSLKFFKNGVSQGVAFTGITLAGNPWYPMISLTEAADELQLNFGAAPGSFKYPQPNAVGFGAAFAIAPTGYQNILNNSDLIVDQHTGGYGAIAITDGAYPCDRWNYGLTYAGINLISRDADDIAAPAPYNRYIVSQVVASVSAPGANDYCFLRQGVEGLNSKVLSWKAPAADGSSVATLIFWAYATFPGKYAGAFRNAAANLSFTFSYTITSASAWQRFAVQIPAPSAGHFTETTTLGVEVCFTLAAGSSLITPEGVWTTGNFLGVTGMQQLPTQPVNAQLLLCGMELRAGSWGAETPPEFKSAQEQNSSCYRYYYKTQGLELFGSYGTGGTGFSYTMNFPTTMRATPSFTSPGFSAQVNVSAFTPTTSPTNYNYNFVAAATGGWLANLNLGAIFNADL